MAERQRSRDGRRETDDYVDNGTATPGQQGRAQGELQRRVGTRDEEKQAERDGAGATRVKGGDERQGGTDTPNATGPGR